MDVYSKWVKIHGHPLYPSTPVPLPMWQFFFVSSSNVTKIIKKNTLFIEPQQPLVLLHLACHRCSFLTVSSTGLPVQLQWIQFLDLFFLSSLFFLSRLSLSLCVFLFSLVSLFYLFLSSLCYLSLDHVPDIGWWLTKGGGTKGDGRVVGEMTKREIWTSSMKVSFSNPHLKVWFPLFSYNFAKRYLHKN